MTAAVLSRWIERRDFGSSSEAKNAYTTKKQFKYAAPTTHSCFWPCTASIRMDEKLAPRKTENINCSRLKRLAISRVCIDAMRQDPGSNAVASPRIVSTAIINPAKVAHTPAAAARASTLAARLGPRRQAARAERPAPPTKIINRSRSRSFSSRRRDAFCEEPGIELFHL